MLRIVTLTSLLLAVACTQTNSSSEPLASDAAAATPPASTCVRNKSITGYEVLDERHLLITAPTRSRTYMITTRSDCRELRFGHTVLISSYSSCVRRNDKIYVPDELVASRCFIESVEWVEDKDAAFKLIEARDKKLTASEVEPQSNGK